MGNRVVERKERGQQGQALIEFALVLPLLFLLIINVVNVAGMLYAWITVANAARTGVQYMVMGDTWVYGLSPPTPTQVTSMVTNDLSSLPNRASAQVTVCINISGTVTPTGCGTPSDPESSLYTSASVDVTYTYQPFIQAWSWPKLGIFLTLPPTTIHRKVVMRCAGGCLAS
jgi:Flp pilus assembly protein TadG